MYELICSYTRNNGAFMEMLWCQERECVVMLDFSTNRFETLTDMKNMNGDMLRYIADDLDEFVYINSYLFYVGVEDFNSIIGSCHNAIQFVRGLIDYGVQIRED